MQRQHHLHTSRANQGECERAGHCVPLATLRNLRKTDVAEHGLEIYIIGYARMLAWLHNKRNRCQPVSALKHNDCGQSQCRVFHSPSSRSWTTIDRPIPLDPPVTTQPRPLKDSRPSMLIARGCEHWPSSVARELTQYSSGHCTEMYSH